ncbi:hypothetical protein ES319_A12G081800v1 [Gossypium barbadense]|uniref:Uncharacterized protein n=2 Tax=Gossypium TaxID=3633 RepID=A0A5J5T7L0_GOSBA|nr:hypothetical protein ES319_A12G081800v1 [Gossypium barbadense]TYG89279.1 hypothetical protein ES288_A12G087200v1 [Gossypium darwinii]
MEIGLFVNFASPLKSLRAPQVYFVGDNVKNLKPELAKGAKLKCCTWLLCEVLPQKLSFPLCKRDSKMSMGLCNSSVKFPNEKSRKAHSAAKFPNKKPRNCLSADDKVPTESGQLKSNTFWGQPENKKD